MAMTDVSKPVVLTAKGSSRTWRVLKALLKKRGAVVGLIIVLLLVLTAIFAPVIAPYKPIKMGTGKPLTAPSLEHPFGTDELGRDLFSRVVYGAQLTLRIGLISVGISLVFGLLVGLLAGYTGGWLERFLMGGMDVLFSFTETLIALAAVAVLGPSLTNALVAVGISQIPFYARVTYGQVLLEKNKVYFESANALGSHHLRILFRHLLPNILPPLLVVGTLGISTAILAVAGLSFLGLGAQPPLSEWGFMLSDGRDQFSKAPWMMFAPGLAIVITVLGFNLLGEALREALDPRSGA